MADDLDIRSSGAAAVDTASLRGAAISSRSVAQKLRDVEGTVSGAAELVAGVPGLRAARDIREDLVFESRRIERVSADADALATALDRAADTYELVELSAARALEPEGSATRAAVEQRAAVLGERLWGTTGADAAFMMLAQSGALSEGDTDGVLLAQAAFGAGLIGAGLVGGFGAIPVGFALAAALQIGAARVQAARASAPAVGTHAGGDTAIVTPLRQSTPQPVDGFEAAANRITSTDGARVRVERYALPDGHREWVVYVTGTQAVTLGGAEAFDMGSNVALYTGAQSAAGDAVRAALVDAGVQPGEPVHAFAHSQGAMVVEALANDGAFDIDTLVTYGSPTTGPLPADVTAVVIRHTDDPVAALAGSLPATDRGSADGFIAQRVADPLPGLRDIALPAHDLDAYAETGALLDASADPRVRALDPLWERLGAADSVRATDYGAERVSPADAADAG